MWTCLDVAVYCPAKTFLERVLQRGKWALNEVDALRWVMRLGYFFFFFFLARTSLDAILSLLRIYCGRDSR